MIKKDQKIEFTYEKELQSSDPESEEAEVAFVEFWVEFSADGEYGPTVSYTEELDAKKRTEGNWTHMPLSFFVEITEFLHKEGYVDKVNWVGGEGKLAKPVVSKKTRGGSGIGVPNVTGGLQQPNVAQPTTQVDFNQQPYNPVQNHPQGYPQQGPQLVHSQGGVEVHNSQPPYQQPEPYVPQHNPAPNPFGGNVAPKVNYGVPSANIMSQQPYQNYQAENQGPQRQGLPPVESFTQMGNPMERTGQQQQHTQQPSPPPPPPQPQNEGDLTAMLNSEVQETPEFLKGAAKSMMEQRANFLKDQMEGNAGGRRLSAVGTVKEPPTLED